MGEPQDTIAIISIVFLNALLGFYQEFRAERYSLFSLGLKSNLPVLGAVLITMILQLSTLYLPSLNTVFKTQPPTIAELTICICASSTVFIVVEIEKWFLRNRLSQNKKPLISQGL